MDDRLQRALDISNLIVTYNKQKELITEQFNQNLLYYYNGGQFTISIDLINYCDLLLRQKKESVILIADNNIPILVENLQVFKDKILENYISVTEKFYNDFSLLKSSRSISKIINE